MKSQPLSLSLPPAGTKNHCFFDFLLRNNQNPSLFLLQKSKKLRQICMFSTYLSLFWCKLKHWEELKMVEYWVHLHSISILFGLQMENYQGDLNDIIRASAESAHFTDMVPQLSSWQQQFPSSDPLSFSSSAMEDNHSTNTFGDPFSSIRDPLLLLQEHNVVGTGSTSTYFNNSPNSTNDHHHMGGFDDMTSPCNIFSWIQISHSSNPLPPCNPPVMAAASTGIGGHKAPAVFPSDMINEKSCLIDNTTTAASVPVQISSPRNLGIKRRLG